MNRAERRRAEKGEAYSGGKKIKLPPCPFPDCSAFIVPGSEFGACATHSKLIKDVLFIFDHTRRPGEVASPAEKRAQAGKPTSSIILPGTRAFQEVVKRV